VEALDHTGLQAQPIKRNSAHACQRAGTKIASPILQAVVGANRLPIATGNNRRSVWLDNFLELLPEDSESLKEEWGAFLQYAVPPRGRSPARSCLRLVVNNQPKGPAPKGTPRWRPERDDDGPQAA
jgi:hypothetical protein